MGKHHAYPEYKDSGIEWLNKVPSNWTLKKLKHIAALLTEKAPERINPVGLENISSWTGKFIHSNTEFDGTGIKFDEGDILFGKLRPYLAKVLLADCCGEAVGDFHVLRPKQASGKFLQRVMLTKEFISIVDGSTFGAKMPRASWQLMSSLGLPLPSLKEQIQIANFLDHETAKIDSLIEKQQQLIKLLKEKRQAVISHAVTKGLNPDTPMRDSGVEWLGEVPHHWTQSRIGWVSTYISYGFTNPMPTADDGPFMLTANDIDFSRIRYGSARKTEAHAFRTRLTNKSRPEKNDILITKDGTLGRVALHDGAEVCINQSVALLRLRINLVNPTFMSLILMGSTYQYRMVYEAGGTAIKHIYISRLAKMPIAFPDLIEQQSIIEELDLKLFKIDKLIGYAMKMIELLKEGRTALISAAVTGKIDVRNWQPSEQNQTQTEIAA